MIKILLLCGDNNRAKSYASVLKKITQCSVLGLLYGIKKDANKLFTKINIDTDSKNYLDSINVNVPSFGKDIESIFIENNWEYTITEEREVNKEEILNEIKIRDCDYVVSVCSCVTKCKFSTNVFCCDFWKCDYFGVCCDIKFASSLVCSNVLSICNSNLFRSSS